MTRSPRHLKDQVKDTVSELPIYAARLAVMGVGRALMLTDRVRKDYREARETGIAPVLGRLRGDAEHLTENVVGKVAGRTSSNGQTAEKPRTRTEKDSEISVGKPPARSTPPKPAAKPATPKPAASKPTAAKHAAAKPEAPKAAASVSKPTAASKAKPAVASKPAATSAAKPATPKPAATKPAAAEPATSKPATSEAAAPKATATKARAAKDLPVSGYDEATLASVRARLRGLDAKQVGELRDYERAHRARADFLRMYENRIAKLKSGS